MTKKEWEVRLSRKLEKRLDKSNKKKALPHYVIEILEALIQDIECYGPNLGLSGKNWPHFGPLNGRDLPLGSYHCHLKKGKPTYVACWYEENKKVKIVEVYYVGTHENAPY